MGAGSGGRVRVPGNGLRVPGNGCGVRATAGGATRPGSPQGDRGGGASEAKREGKEGARSGQSPRPSHHTRQGVCPAYGAPRPSAGHWTTLCPTPTLPALHTLERILKNRLNADPLPCINVCTGRADPPAGRGTGSPRRIRRRCNRPKCIGPLTGRLTTKSKGSGNAPRIPRSARRANAHPYGLRRNQTHTPE